MEPGYLRLEWNSVSGADYYTIYTNNAGKAPVPTFRRLADDKTGFVKRVKARR